jgi:HAE1 family hydrophobic/amphiphilic exporter-1
MDIVRFSINRPVTIIVGVILVVLFGLIGLNRLPYQLSPTVVEPDITVKTSWPGATPYEIEREIIEPQERTLKGIPGLKEMESDSRNGLGTVTLRFKIGTDVDDALLRVSNKVNEVKRYPEGADRPVISATGAATSPIIWLVMKTAEGNERLVQTYRTLFEDEIRQHLERVEGVADLFVGGGRLEQMQVMVRPESLAAHGLTIGDLIRVLSSENINVSAGTMGVGRRDYRIRTTGEFKDEKDIRGIVLRSTGQRRVTVGDIAEVRRGYEKENAIVIHNGSPGMAVGIIPEAGVNVLELTERMEKTVNRLNEEKLKPEGIYFNWVYDQRWYINGAIRLIKNNIFIGGILAITVLLTFLRSLRSTIVVATAIPISIIGTFLVLYLTGRNLNVVSLAGIAFAVGMLVDNSIVVIENIDRHRKLGKSALEASYEGAKEVWGAVLASTLTTIAVFLPVVFVQEEAGQLFRDIAIAVVAAVSLSFIVSVSVIPSFSRKLFALQGSSGRLNGSENAFTRLSHETAERAKRASAAIMRLVSIAIDSWASRAVTVGGLTVFAILVFFVLLPKTDYLPQGNRNFVLNIFVPPPGLSNEERKDIGETFFAQTAPYIGKDEVDGVPGIENMFYVGTDWIMLAGAISTQWDRAGELLPMFRRMIFSVPGMFGVSMQPGIFQSRLGRSRTVDLDLSGGDLNAIVRAAGMMFGKMRQERPQYQVRPIPSIELIYPEVRIIPDRDRLRANGMTTSDLGTALDVLMDGRDIGDFKQEGRKKIDLVLMAGSGEAGTPEDLYHSMVATPSGRVVPVSSLSGLERTQGITQIRHLERSRSITLQITPPLDTPLQSVMEDIDSGFITPMRGQGLLKGIDVRMAGAADKLKVTQKAMQWNFVLAAAIAYLLMSALFGNFLYPLIIMFTVPLAGAGGIIGLRVLGLFVNQPLDILTMLGFVILIGIVVNNAILIVHQSLNNVRSHGMAHREAVIEATRTRLRPIYMSAFTSIFGMLPLVIFPGAGSELYRGLGSVIIGGIAVSTIFTVFIIPSLLMFAIRMEQSGEEVSEESTR